MKVSSSTKLIQHLPRNGTQLVGCAVRQICEIPLLQPWFVGDRLSMTLQSWIVFGMQLFKFHSRLGYTSTMLVHMHIYMYIYIYMYHYFFMNYASQIRVIRAQIDKSDTQHVRGDHIQPLNNHLFVDTVDFNIVIGVSPNLWRSKFHGCSHFSTSAAPQSTEQGQKTATATPQNSLWK